jgi:CRISPR-associated endonuclease Csn1
MKQILGLDLGTNSIGWALIDSNHHNIIKAGSRIIPMDAAAMSDYERGNLQSQASVRTGFRGTRRLYQRATLRRERLFRVLHQLRWLPEHFDNQIDWDEHPGQFKNHNEPLLPYRKGADGNNEFVFKDSFNEMLEDFRKHHPDRVVGERKVPYDWTIYYLRDKALTKPVRREELAWIILNFNTKRGYYQLRGRDDLGAEEEPKNKREEYKRLRVERVDFLEPDRKKKGYNWYDVVYEGDVVQRKNSVNPPRRVGDEVEVIITTKLDKNGEEKKNKDGMPLITVRDPKEDDWKLMKKRSEYLINEADITVGSYIYRAMLSDPKVKVRGKLVRTIERRFYRSELRAILDKQREFIPELNNRETMEKCVRELYRNNETHVASLTDKSFTDFIVDDIIFYQRPLKSKKSEIANCPLEHYRYVDKETGEIVEKPIKCIPKSNPLYQEFRLWQFVQNLSILKREKIVGGKLRTDVNVTAEYLGGLDEIAALYEQLCDYGSISQKQLLKLFSLDEKDYRWNYPEEKIYPCNETHHDIVVALQKTEGKPRLDADQEMRLWHILYSVDDLIDLEKALTRFAEDNGFDVSTFVQSFLHFKPFDNDYGAYSEKAIKRLLPLMRAGGYWNVKSIDSSTCDRMDKLMNGIEDDTISRRTREKAISLTEVRSFQYLPLWLACYVVYDRHSEAADLTVWKKPEDIDRYLLFSFRQHALRNPVVEKVLGETLRVVRDIWKTYGKIDEVHVEMGRNLKAPAKNREQASRRIAENERTNFRIRMLLQEFVNPDYEITDVRPQSPGQFEILKLYEDYALNSGEAVPDDILSIQSNLGDASKHVSKSDVMRYRLWLEQRYRSPYTGGVIPLSKLFTPAYEIEHIIPQSRYFDDSLSNKVICESEVNKLKGSMLGYEFILKEGGRVVTGNLGKEIKIFTKDGYEDFVRQQYAYNRGKMRKLLMEDIPDSFIERQLNDSRYIARKTIAILSHLVRTADEQEATSKNVVVTTGGITDLLKKEWGLTDVWNDLVAPRFERLNAMTGSNAFGEWANKDGKRFFRTNVPKEISLGFSKKRIDHRHHAMDAIVIACATRDHVNFLNNSSALKSQKGYRHDLRRKLCEKIMIDERGNYIWRFRKPWETFTQDAKAELQDIIVSFKQNLRVATRMTNQYWRYENGRKILARQQRGDGWAIRKPLHKATISGAVRLQEKKKVKLADALPVWNMIVDKQVRRAVKAAIDKYNRFDVKTILRYIKDNYGNKVGDKDISRVEIWHVPKEPTHSVSRIALDESFDKKKIDAVTDSGIRKILLRHLSNNEDDPKVAFSPEGIAEMNRNIRELNGGRPHQPIFKVRKAETLGLKFPIGGVGSKKAQFVEAAAGTNLFFAIYVDEEGKRSYESIPFNEAVERKKQGLPVAPEVNKQNEKLLFVLSPNDLVYVPEEGEHIDMTMLSRERIWKFVSCTKKAAYFIQQNIAHVIINGVEFGSLNKLQSDDCGISLKSVCMKMKVNRLGMIEKI